MKSRFLIISIFVLSINILFGQEWRTEFEKHKDLPVKEIIKNMESYFTIVGATRANKYHHWIRYQNQIVNHVSESGFITNHSEKNIGLLHKFEKKLNKTNHSESRHFHGGWEPANPSNFQTPSNSHPSMGRINCIAIPPSNGNIIYAGAATGGVWKTYNHGATWIPLWDGMVQMGVSDIILDYTNENHIIVITGDADGRNLPYAGLYHSYDAGSTWSEYLSFEGFYFEDAYRIIQSKTNPEKYYVASNGINSSIIQIDFSTSPIGYNGQGSWDKPDGFEVEYKTGSSNVLFAATRNGILKKTEPGAWEVHDVPGLPTGVWGRTELAMAPSDSEVMYYMVGTQATQTTPADYGIFKSINGGDSFVQIYGTSDTDHISNQSWYNFVLNVDPSNSDIVYVGAVGYYKYTSSTDSLTADNTGLHADIHRCYFINDKQYVCTDGGLSYRDVGDTDFISINNGLLTTQFYKIDVSGNRLMGGTQDNGTLFWDEGDAVGIRKLGGDGFDCIYHPTNNDIVFTSTQENTYRSTNNGETNNIVKPSRWAAPIQFWPGVSSRMISFDKTQIRFSYNTGLTWPDSLDIFSDNGQLISGFSQCESSTNTAYACNAEQVLRTDNFNTPASSAWDDFTTGLDIDENSIIRNILVNPNNSGEVYLTIAGYVGTQIYKSTNGGGDWDDYDQGLGDFPVYCIYFDHVNNDGFYIGTEFGVFYRNNSMDEWIPFSTYLPRVQVMDLNITDTHVYAGTFGRGMWKSEGYKDCYASLTLTQANDPTNGEPSGQQIHKASNIITSNRIITGSAGTDVTYQAGNYVDLTTGFLAKQYNLFTARAAGCNE